MDADAKIQAEYQQVLDFWFGAPGSPGYGQARNEWFVKKRAFDARIRERFGALHARARAGDLASWVGNPSSLLALIIVLDQFSRNLFRGDAASFAGDPVALGAARMMVKHGWDARLMPVARVFVYLPFEHAESVEAQEESVRLFSTLTVELGTEEWVEWARKHQEVIRRFGRFPHRNALLGRDSTTEEAVFLKQPGSRF